jgi:hypothetical protein
MLAVISEKYTRTRRYTTAPRKEIAQFMGIDQSDLSDDCYLLGFAPRAALDLKQVFTLWLFRWGCKLLKKDRRDVAKLVETEEGVSLLLEQLTKSKVTPDLFCKQFERWLRTGECIRLTRQQPAHLRQSRLKRTGTITRRSAAQILDVSPATITRYQQIDAALVKYKGARLDKAAWQRLFVDCTNFKVYKALCLAQRRRVSLAAFTKLSKSGDASYQYYAKRGDTLGYTNELGSKLFDDAVNGKINRLKIDGVTPIN